MENLREVEKYTHKKSPILVGLSSNFFDLLFKKRSGRDSNSRPPA